MDKIGFHCPHCGKRISAPAKTAGRTARCPGCEKTLKVPAPEETIAPAAAREPTMNPPPLPAAPPPETQAAVPWEKPPDLWDKAIRYRDEQQGTAFLCKSNEFLNGLSKKETMRDAVVEAEFLVGRDLAWIDGRPTWAERLVEWLEARFGPGAGLILLPLRLTGFFVNPFNILGLLISLAFYGLLLSLLMMLISAYPLYSLIVAVILGAGVYLYHVLSVRQMNRTIQRIVQDPSGPFSIRKLFEFLPVIPRLWEPADVVQLVRLDTRHRLRKRALLLLVQDNPLPLRSFWSSGLGLAIGRWFRGDRRVYVLSFDGGPDAADEAAEAASKLFMIPIHHATFFGGVLRMAKETS